MNNPAKHPTRFVFEVDLSAVTGDPAEELSRALRYWAGNLKHYDLTEPVTEAVYDSEYAEVGQWTIS